MEINETTLAESLVCCERCGFNLYYLVRGDNRDPPFCRKCHPGTLDAAIKVAVNFRLFPRDDSGRIKASAE